jgi:methionine-S-sulfoxide reductase
VVRTRVGYAGGTSPNPTYHNLGDHTEAIAMDYDPAKISYQELVEIFWASHVPTQKAWSRQYMAIIFAQGDKQEQVAQETKKIMELRGRSKIYTEVAASTEFYLAEDYHQKYYLQKTPQLMEEYKNLYPEWSEFISSTAVARVNGYIAGYGTIGALQKEINMLGLSERGKKILIKKKGVNVDE